MSNLSVKEFKEVNSALVPQNENGVVNAVDARKLHAYLEVGTDFSNWIKRRISKYDFKENIDYITVAKNGGGVSSGFQPIEYYISTNMGKELAMVENNEIGKKVRKYYIDLEAKYLAQNDWKNNRNNVKVDYKEMSIALEEHRSELGKETKFFHYANEADMINRIVLGMTSSQYKKHHDLSSGDSIRDLFTPVQLQVTHTLQKHNSAFIEAGFKFDKRKEMLNDIFMRRYNKRLIAEHIAIEA